MKGFYITVLGICMFVLPGFAQSLPQDSVRFATEDARQSPKLTLAQNRIVIENLPSDDVLEVYNIMGVKIYSQRIKSGTNEYAVDLPRGYYIIKAGKLVKKVAVR